ncbi:pteridine reductase [Dokdonella koreensis]|uniref:Short-chain dehydrogenase/reductase SDR n=1 Tax=Dokdonella koreensis DS-123 TaxID=1300342 RepID=A0A160DVM7_9GAMM|nr:pteridine reductase [Dokdonella koreensis]ANB18424.1 Short-chain dehydrogenase/reductase SDR [Dokdonella koreensis DS-123]
MTATGPKRRVVLVTGAARRIGAAIARSLHAAGCDIVLHYRGSRSEAEALARELDAVRAGSTLCVAADLADAAALPGLVDAARARFGRLDGLVNNASAFHATPFGAVTPDHWQALFAANAQAPLLLAQAAAPFLRSAGGAIVNLADIYADRPKADSLVYSAAKAALVSLTRSLAIALAPEVRVNAVAPGAILWPEQTADADAAAERAAMLARTPLGRTGQAAEVAEAVRWLLLDAGYVTGQVLAVDGGRSVVD